MNNSMDLFPASRTSVHCHNFHTIFSSRNCLPYIHVQELSRQADPHVEGCSPSKEAVTQQEALNPDTAGAGAALPQLLLLLIHRASPFFLCL